MPLDAESARRLFSQFATGVAVVTATGGDGQPAGMTASSIASVSLDPPLLLVCVHEAADFHAVIVTASRFSVNILAADQEELARHFASGLPNKFAGIAHTHAAGAPPLLDRVAAYLHCDSWRVDRAADHAVVFGRVTGGAVFERPPLLHYRSRYASTAPGA